MPLDDFLSNLRNNEKIYRLRKKIKKIKKNYWVPTCTPPPPCKNHDTYITSRCVYSNFGS